MKNKLAVLGGLALLAVNVNANAAAVGVDLFTVGQARVTDSTVNATAEFSSINDPLFPGLGATILGGNRDIGVNLGSDPFSNGAYVQVAGGAFSFNTGSLATATATVQWDGANNNLTLDTLGLGGIDITNGGVNNLFEVKTIFSDGGFLFDIGIWDMTGKSVIAHLGSNAHATPATSFLGLNTWANGDATGTFGLTFGGGASAGNGVDLKNIGAIQLIVDPFASFVSLDLTIDSIKTVPEPSSLGLLGIGLLSAGFAKRRKNKTA